MSQARQSLDESSQALQVLLARRAQLADALRAQQTLAAELPGLDASVSAAVARIDTVQKSLVDAEKRTAEAVRSAGELGSKGTLAKHDFAAGILDVLGVLLVDGRTASAAKQILDELAREYGGDGLPADLQERASALGGVIAKLGA